MTERRKHPRRIGSEGVVVRYGILNPGGNGNSFRSMPHRGQLVDVSMNGCAFDVVETFETGSRIIVELRPTDLIEHKSRLATVVRMEETDCERHRIFCRFEQSLSLDDLSEFGRYSFAGNLV